VNVVTSTGGINETAAHEAGHVVIGFRRFGLLPDLVSIERAADGTTGRCQWTWSRVDRIRPFLDDQPGGARVRPGLLSAQELVTCRDLLAVHLAGLLAAAEVTGSVHPERAGSDMTEVQRLAGYADLVEPGQVIENVKEEVRAELGFDLHLRLKISRALVQSEHLSESQLRQLVAEPAA